MKYVWLSVGLLILGLGAISGWVFTSIDQPSPNTANAQVQIAKGAGIRDVAAGLAKAKVIRSAQAWTLFALLTDQAKSILPGTYIIAPKTTGRALLQQISTTPVDDREVSVTILEGWKLQEIADELEKKDVVGAQVFLNVAQRPSASGIDLNTFAIAGSKPANVDLEGYLFPDTYRFFKKSTAVEVIKKMLNNLDVRYDAAMRTATQNSGHSIHEILTMASILEKELTTTADKAKGSDVFWKRIKVGMPLQSNVTIMYAMGLKEDRLSIADTKFESPYNTYKYKGLPPGPINSPGISSIKAAITPEPNNFYYFLASPAGVTYFAVTLEEHNINKAKYLK